MRLRHQLTAVAVYLALFAVVFSGAARRERAQVAAPSPAPSVAAKPSFSLSTNRTYATSDNPRVWINYQGIDHLDFRVYKIKDPIKFFKQLNDPHQMGSEEKREVAGAYRRGPALLERLRSFKSSIYLGFKRYIRSQLRQPSRVAFNDRFRSGERVPLNVADYATVPLLNPDQVVKRWREVLTPLENEYDSRNVPLGRREPGVYLVEAVNGELRAYTISIVSDLTMLTKTAPSGEILIYAVDRRTGEPRSGVRVDIGRGKQTLATGSTDRDGLLRTSVKREREPRAPATPPEDVDPEAERRRSEDDAFLIMGSNGGEFTISDLQPHYFGWYGQEDEEGLTSYIYTDRPIYRPDQKVYFKGLLRRLGDEGYVLPPARSVLVTIEDPNNAKLLEKELPLSARGSFSGEVEVAPGAPLGAYRIIARVGEMTASHYFEVAEYKKPEYKVTVTAAKRFVPVGEKTKFTIEARYFFGSPVANAAVRYYIYRSRYHHWWFRDDEDDVIGAEAEPEDEGAAYGYDSDMVKEGEGKIGADGKMEVEFTVPPADEKEAWDYSYRLEAQVTDASRRQINGQASFIGTRGRIVAFAQPERYVYYEGETAPIRVRTSDYEGRPVASRVRLQFIRQTWDRIDKGGEGKYERYEYRLRESEVGSGEVTTNAEGEARYEFRVPAPGSIYIRTLVEEGGRQIVSRGGFLWVADRNDRWAETASQDYGSIKLVPDRKSYRPGETAKVLAMLPIERAQLLVTTERDGVLTARRISAAGRATVIEVPIEARHAPNIYLSVACVRDGEMYSSDKLLAVPARDRFLQLEVIPDKSEYKPREVASYTVLARHADGSAAPGVEVSLGVVDEAIYSIRPDSSGDIRRAFYGQRYNRVQTNFAIAYNFTGYSDDQPLKLARRRAGSSLADVKNEAQYAEPTVRKDFKDTAHWQPDLVTGADGRARASVKLPDNLTTWRATARAVSADTRVGSKVVKVVARKDLILRLETPRFLSEGDTATLSGIVHNYLNADKPAQISLEVAGANLLDESRRSVTISRQGETRVDWRVKATGLGEVKLLAKALTDAESDAIELPLPVIPAGLKRTTGGTETMAEESVEKTISLDLPDDANAQARSLRIEALPSIAASLFGALDYLTSYPYGCTEQTMSSFLPNVIVAQTLKSFKTASIRASNDLEKKVRRGIDRLYRMQHDDGGWGWWKDDPTDPFMTAYVMDGLTQARSSGYAIENYRYENGQRRMRALLEAGKTGDNKSLDGENRAYLVYALAGSGETDARFVNDLFARRGELQPRGRALLALTLLRLGDEARARSVAADLERAARVNEFDAHWESSRQPTPDFMIINDIEATAFALKALAALQPQSPLLPKAARWLVGRRAHGAWWNSTKDTAFAIFGLADYLRVSRELAPDFTVEIYLNGEQVLARRMTAADLAGGAGLVIERRGATLGNGNRIRVVKQGRGVLYLASTLDYYTRDENIAAGSTPNLKLTREYLRLKVTESGGKPKWTTEPLTGELRSGDLIVSRLRVQGARAQYLMIEDPIPAGGEQIEAVSGINLNADDGKWTDWYSAREFRDQKTALFVNYFDGDAVFQYALRVGVPGAFRAGPARAELMYQPTVQSNTAGTRFNILDR